MEVSEKQVSENPKDSKKKAAEKIVITGDVEQIDNSKLDALNNGLSYIIDKFKSSNLAGHISLKEGERSPLAEEAAKIL